MNLSDSNDIAIINRRKTDRRRSNLLIERVISPLSRLFHPSEHPSALIEIPDSPLPEY